MGTTNSMRSKISMGTKTNMGTKQRSAWEIKNPHKDLTNSFNLSKKTNSLFSH